MFSNFNITLQFPYLNTGLDIFEPTMMFISTLWAKLNQLHFFYISAKFTFDIKKGRHHVFLSIHMHTSSFLQSWSGSLSNFQM